MDKRFFLALLLSALVVAVVPRLFNMTPARTSGATPSATGTKATATPEQPRPATETGELPATGAAPETAVPSVTTQQQRVDTTVLASPKALYRFSNLGAALLSGELLEHRALGRSGGQARVIAPGVPLLRYRLLIPGDTVRLDRLVFQSEPVAAGETVRYVAGLPRGGRVSIAYTLAPESYVLRVRGTVEGVAGGYLLLDLPPSLISQEGDTIADQRMLSYAVKPQRRGAVGIPFSKLDPGERHIEEGPITWAAAKNKYFLIGALTENGDAPFSEVRVEGGARTSKTPTLGSATVVEALTEGRFAFELYVGPQEWRRLNQLGRDFENVNPYGGFLQGMVQPFATLVMRLLLWMHHALSLSYGWVLVIMGIAVRLVMWPLNQRAMRASLQMQRVQPQLQEVQKKYASTPEKLQTEMMKVYKDHGMSPFSAFSGCLPLLIPMPVFFALFFVLQNTIEFRGVPFLWLADISLKDPYYVLPVLTGLTAFALSWIGMKSAPPNPQMKMMTYVFPVVMLVFCIPASAGLNIYYTVQNLAALPQQWLIGRERMKTAAAGGALAAAPARR